jgi:galactose mutarotase-like enzyme
MMSCNIRKEKEETIVENLDKKEKSLITAVMHTIKNEQLTVTLQTKGAELVGLKTDALEFIWQADPNIWPRHAPLLFPIVGRLVDHEYVYNDKTYSMKQHGFARNNDFKVIAKTENSILFEQIATNKSKEIYPFDFILNVKYTLLGTKLVTEYIVKNPSNDKDLYFSIGAHPAFSCPFEEGQKRSDYQLVFDKKLAPKGQVNTKGLFEGDLLSVFSEKGIITISDTLFDNDSFAFNPNPFSKVTFVHKPTQKKYLSVSFKNFPYLGIWSKRNVAPFVCIEPWHGIADKKSHNKDYKQKEGVKKLAPQDVFSCSFTIETYE